MKLLKSVRRFATGVAAVSAVAFSAGVMAAPVNNTAGGATIHNAATLTYNSGQQVTSSVNVEVLTVATAPSITLTSVGPFEVNAGDTITLNYTIKANANGSDSYSLATTSSTDTGLTAGTVYTPSTNTVTLGASVTVAASVEVDGDTGTLFIPAGSQTNLVVGDTVVIGTHPYVIDAIRAGTIASTSVNTTTPETYTEIDLTVPLLSGSPSIGDFTVPIGTQFGERGTFSVAVTVTSPTTVGTDGEVNPVVTGNTSALDTSGTSVSFDTSTDGSGTNDPTITVLSATVTILKEARNVTKGVLAFDVTDVFAQSGDVLEYRITMTAAPGTGDAINSVLTDILPEYTDYVASSTTLNGSAVTDDLGVAFPLSSVNSGLEVNSANGASGVLVDGDTGVNAAIVIFRVTVQ